MFRKRFVLVAVLVLAISWVAGLTSDTIHWKSIGPGAGGNMFTATVSPSDPRIVLMGSDVGGIFRSADGGITWSLRNNALVAPTIVGNYYVGPDTSFAFAKDQGGAYTVVYLGSLKSTDSGVTWTEMVPGHIDGRLTVVDPNDSTSNTVYVAGSGHVYKTVNGFANGDYVYPPTNCWSAPPVQGHADCPISCLPRPDGNATCPRQDISIHSLIVDPGSPGHLLICAGPDPAGGLFESWDGALTWTRLVAPTNLTGPPANFQCNHLAFHAASRTLYMTIGTISTPEEPDNWNRVESWQGGVWQSQLPSQAGAYVWSSFNGEASEQPDVFQGSGAFEQPGAPAAGWNLEGGTVLRVQTQNRVAQDQLTWALETGNGTDPVGYVMSACVPVQGGKVYELAAWAKLENYGSCQAPLDLTFQTYMDFFSDPACSWSSALNFPGTATNEPKTCSDNKAAYNSTAGPPFGWRKFMTLVRPPTDQVVYAQLHLAARTMPGCGGHTYFDDVTFRQVDSLPKVGGRADSDALISYDAIVVDPNNVNTVYVGTFAAPDSTYTLADTQGVWKSQLDGSVVHWNHVTRATYKDNVQDGIFTAPRCGNGQCEGRWENCNTCPADCTGPTFAPPPACCGNGQVETGETDANCRVDVPPYVVTGRFYYEYEPRPDFRVWTLAIGKDQPVEVPPVPPGNQTLYMSAREPYVTTNGGDLWTQLSSDYAAPPQVPEPSWAARGDTNDVNALAVVTDHRPIGGIPVNRVYYGDLDNQLQVSYDGGVHFAKEGQPWGTLNRGPAGGGDSVSSIVLDPVDPNTIYCGLSCGEGSTQLVNGFCAAMVTGTFSPAVGTWSWDHLDDLTNVPNYGSVELLHSDLGGGQRMFIASIYKQGIYRDINGVWTNTGAFPSGSDVHRLVQESPGGRLYLAVDGLAAAGDVSGVWEGSPDGSTWCKISDPTLANLPVLAIAPNGPTTLFVGTAADSTGAGGGIYKGQRTAICTCSPGNTCWTWTPVLTGQPKVSSIVVSPASSSILYASVGQTCCFYDVAGQQAGIYKSVTGGDSWTPLANDGLMNIAADRLTFDPNFPHLLYAGTYGDGIFQGTITCGPPAEGFVDTDLDGDPDCSDCAPLDPAINHSAGEGIGALSTCFDGVDNNCNGIVDLDCAVPIYAGTGGQNVVTGSASGSVSELAAASANNVYEALTEGGSGSARQLKVVWTVPTTSMLAGTSSDLRVEGFRNASANDTFNFSFSSRSTTEVCTSSEGGTASILSVSKTSDDNQLQVADLGTASATYCVKVVDSKLSGDSSPDTLTLDRLFVFPSPVALSDYAAAGDVGTVISGTFASTQLSENTREALSEGQSGGAYRLWHTWSFKNVPAGTSHKLHLEGYRAVGTGGKLDDFQFYWSTDPTTWSPTNPTTGFTLITGGIINTTSDVAINSSNFGPGTLSGTVYIRVIDAQKAQTAGWQNTLYVDHLVIKTVP